MDNEPKTFSLVPQTEDEMNDLAERGIDWIKAKLLDAEAHIPVVAQTKAVALETDTTDADDYYALLAYRSLVEFGRLLEHVQGLAAEDMTIASLAEQFGVSYSTAHGVVNGDT